MKGSGGAVGGEESLGHKAVPASPFLAIDVFRPGFGNAGRQINIHVNTSAMNIPDITVYHYGVGWYLQDLSSNAYYPNVFIRAAIYDSKNNLCTSYKLNFGTGLSRQFDVTWTDGDRASNTKITVTEAREINMEYTAGLQSWDDNVSAALSDTAEIFQRYLPVVLMLTTPTSSDVDVHTVALLNGGGYLHSFLTSVLSSLNEFEARLVGPQHGALPWHRIISPSQPRSITQLSGAYCLIQTGLFALRPLQ
ncbi:hypothetical protein EDD85DRAFT_794395 [Armillaria nabsnona]|nr:hypothetical protein EDD85DRAFT_794395 [Armillaria nabsnona]